MFESKNRKSSYQNQKIEFGITEYKIRVNAKQLTRKIVTALVVVISVYFDLSHFITCSSTSVDLNATFEIDLMTLWSNALLQRFFFRYLKYAKLKIYLCK